MRVLVALAVLVTLLTSCSHHPRLLRQNEETLTLRTQYLQSNPDGEFNALIAKSEVTSGMGAMEVLAAWGVPNWRRGVENRPVEFWTYYEKDEATKTYVSYDLVFENRVLRRWVVTDNIASYDDLVERDLTGLYREYGGLTKIAPAQADSETLKKK